MLNEYRPNTFAQWFVLSLSVIILLSSLIAALSPAPLWMGLRLSSISIILFAGLYCLVMKKIENNRTFTFSFLGLGLYVSTAFMG